MSTESDSSEWIQTALDDTVKRLSSEWNVVAMTCSRHHARLALLAINTAEADLNRIAAKLVIVRLRDVKMTSNASGRTETMEKVSKIHIWERMYALMQPMNG